ncbi:hypothetical protein ACFL4T_00150 [candidate division KSB1 bacterium]
MYYLKYLKFLSLAVLIIHNCSLTGTDEKSTTANPVIISYNWEKENQIQDRWEQFLDFYNAATMDKGTIFMKPTSYLMQTYFENNLPKIIPDSITSSNKEDFIPDLLGFYEKWQDLFGCKVENLEFERLDDYSLYGNYFNYRFEQVKLNNRRVKFVYRRWIRFRVNTNGELLQIVSALYPDVEIEKPEKAYIHNMIHSTMGYKHKFHLSGSSIMYPDHEFTSKDSYNIKDDFEIYLQYTENKAYVYYLKGIKYYWIEDDHNYKCTIYYHPETTEKILVSIY